MNVRTKRSSALLGVLGCLAAIGCGDDKLLNDEGEEVKAVVEAHVAPDESCKLDVKGQVVARGLFDISRAAASDSACSNDYELNLRVHNLAGSSVVFSSATVTLENANAEKIDFESGQKKKLPNPYETRTASPVPASDTGIVTVVAIPASYAAQLFTSKFVGQEVAATVVLHGVTESGLPVASRQFTFPIELCKDCLRVCKQQMDQLEDPASIYGGKCSDHAGADDRVCVDPDC